MRKTLQLPASEKRTRRATNRGWRSLNPAVYPKTRAGIPKIGAGIPLNLTGGPKLGPGSPQTGPGVSQNRGLGASLNSSGSLPKLELGCS